MITDKQVEAALRAYWSASYSTTEKLKVRAALEAADRAAWEPMESAPHKQDVLLSTPEGLELNWASGGGCSGNGYSWKWYHGSAVAWRHLPGGPGDE